jgi:hypothetical protein
MRARYGANMGHHTAPLCRLVGEAGQIHAFEPNIAHLKILASIAQTVRIWPFAAANQMSLQHLHYPAGLDAGPPFRIFDRAAGSKDGLLSTVQIPIDRVLSEIRLLSSMGRSEARVTST